MTLIWPYFVGDIHGCWDSYRALEDRIQAHAARHGARPVIVSVGDLVDRGPSSPAVVRHFRLGAAAGTHAAVLGNHDVLLLESLSVFGPEPLCWPARLMHVDDLIAAGEKSARWLTPRDYRAYRKALWLTQGGYQTLAAYGCDPLDEAGWRIDPEDLAFLLALPVVWQDDRFVVTHALATAAALALARLAEGPGDGAGDGAEGGPTAREVKQACDALIWNRRPPDRPADPDRLHLSGHTPVGRPRRRPDLGYVQIDTGCVYGGRLTALCGPTGESFSEPLRDRVAF